MLMAGDGGANILWTKDSLIELKEDAYDYILANIPYGAYAGEADVNQFEFGRYRRFEYLFLEKIVKALKFGCHAAVIVPDGLVENSSLLPTVVRFSQTLICMRSSHCRHSRFFLIRMRRRTFYIFQENHFVSGARCRMNRCGIVL